MGWLRQRILSVLGHGATDPAEPSASADQPAADPSASDKRADPATRFREAAENVRRRTDLAAKTLAAVGTTAVGWAGLDRFTDVFPWPDAPPVELAFAIAGVVAGLVALGVAVFGFTYRLWRVQEPIFSSSVPQHMGLAADEEAIVRRVFNRTAALNDAPSLYAFEARAHRYKRIAEALDAESDQATRLRDKAKRIEDAVRTSHARALSEVIRFRAAQAIRGGWAWGLYLLGVAGLIGFGLGADYVEGERARDKERIAEVKSCAEAVKAAGAAQESRLVQELPDACGDLSAASGTNQNEAEAKPSPDKEVAAGVEELGARLTSCIEALDEADGNVDPTRCDRIRRAISALTE